MTYNHTQIGYVIIALALLSFVPAIIIWKNGAPDWILWLLLAVPIVILVFGSLNVRLDGENLAIRFGLGLVRKTFPLDQISASEPVTNKFYYGWGIRYTPHGWLYNVSGTDAVQLHMTSGKKVRIGTDDPQRLHAALQAVLPAQTAR